MTERAAPLSARAAPVAEPTVAASLVRTMQQYALARGVPPEVARTGLGRHATQLDDPEHRVPASAYDRCYQACAQALDGPDFGLRLGASARASHLGVLGFLLMASRSFGAALQAYQRYQRALGETLQLRLSVAGGRATLAIRALYGLAGDAQRVESTAAAIHVLVQELCGRSVDWQAASFEHLAAGADPGPRAAALRAVLGVMPTRGPNRLHFDAQALDWPLQRAEADATLAGVLHEQLARRTAALDQRELAPQAAATLRRALAAGQRLSVLGLARELGLGARALQQRLQDEGTTVRALADAAGHDTAVALLGQGASTGEVARLLGFADDAAFFRAFRRWTGGTPAQWRAGLRPWRLRR